MMKQKLPKNWIVLNSKTHPDRVYYFNVKTNESSWEEPPAEQSEKSGKKPVTPPRKRKRSNRDDGTQFEPTTPEYNIPQEKFTERKKLVAKRSIKQSLERVSENKETPQMQILREKMLKKKEKDNVSKNKSPRHAKNLETSSVSKTRTNSSLNTSENQSNPKEVCTPQMMAILQKKNEKTSKSTIKSKKVEQSKQQSKEDDSKNKETESPRASRIKNQESRGSIEKNTTRRKTVGSVSVESISIKKQQKSFKKNLGKERMDKLRNSLSSQNSNSESSNQENPRLVDKLEKLPPSHKNAEVRLVRLKEKLLKDKISSSKSSCIDECKEKEKSITTVQDLVEQANKDSFYEEMDWEPMQDEKITFEVQAVRTQLCIENNVNASCTIPTNVLKYPLSVEQQERRQLYIIVDTNVFLSNIEAIELAKDAIFKTYDKPIIVIPWTVIRELDYIKGDNGKTKSAALCYKARQAVNYINKLFSSKHPRVIGQRPEDVAKNKEKFAINCPDDEILQLCLQILELEKSVVLLSYDKNFCNKAMIHDIVTLGRNDPLEKIDYLNAVNNSKEVSGSFQEQSRTRLSLEAMSPLHQEKRLGNEIFEHTKNVMKDFLTEIVSKEMRELYGDSWEHYVIIKPPWTVVTVLQCVVKHWIAAISESFSRKAEHILKELLLVFKNTSDERTLREVSCVLEKCSNLIQMVNTDKYPDLMFQASEKIYELKEKCRNYQHEINGQKLRDVIGVENNIEQEQRAQKAFQYFETAYVFARDMCGLAAEAARMPCSFHYNTLNPLPTADYVKQIQPELAANVNRLLHTLSAVLEQHNTSSIDSRTLTNLQQSLVTFLPDSVPQAFELNNNDLEPLDVYCCVKFKEVVLRTGLRQLQDLSTHFCRLASFRCT